LPVHRFFNQARTMASSDNHYGGDSESEDDNFNPAPADLSDDENGNAGKIQQTSSPAPEEDQRYSRPAGGAASKRPIQLTRDEDEDEENEEEEEEEEDDGGQQNADDDEEEEDDEDEDDVQGVSLTPSPLSMLAPPLAGVL
jgi:transcription elongation factor SPT5